MKNLLYVLFLFPFICNAQLYPTQVIGTDTMLSNAAGDSLWKSVNGVREFYFKTPTKRVVDWNIIRNKPLAYTAANHSHPIADVTGLQAAIDAKGTSNFDGTYPSLTGKPATFIATAHTHTISDITNFGSYANATHTHLKADITDFPTTTAGFTNSANKNFVTDAQATVIGNTTGANTGDNAANTTYQNDYRAANFIAGTNYLAVNGNGSALTGLTASQVGLANVNNTSDASKPVSTAQQTAINLKVNISDSGTMLNPYVRANVAAATYSLLGHVHIIANTTGLQAALDAKQASLGYTPLNPANNLSEVTATTARGNLGATTVGANIFTLANPSAIRFLRINADNTVTARTAAEILSDIGAQASGSYLTGNQTITFTPTGDVTGSSSNATSLTPVLAIGALKVTSAMLAGSIPASKLVGTDIATLAKNTSYNGITSVSNGLSQVVATIDATAQAANIATATLYAVPSAGFYRVNIYITVTQAATTSSTMPSTTITYTDGNSGTNAHSTTTTATNASNSLTTSFAQTTYVLYAKASTNIQYATGSYASSGATVMQYALRIRVEAL
jgi:hypothetical protein